MTIHSVRSLSTHERELEDFLVSPSEGGVEGVSVSVSPAAAATGEAVGDSQDLGVSERRISAVSMSTDRRLDSCASASALACCVRLLSGDIMSWSWSWSCGLWGG